MKSREHVTTNGRAVFFASMWEDLRQAAISHGWALGLHGSLANDMDIMAMPWDEHANSVEAMIAQLCICFTESSEIEKNIKVTTDKPNNRTVYTLPIWADFYLDINVIGAPSQPSEQKPTDLCQGCMGTGVDMHGQRCLNCKGTGAEDVSKALQQHQNYKGGLKILERHLGELYYQSGNLHGQIFEAMQEFAQQSRQQARSEAIQQCIELVIERIRNAGRAEQNGGAEYYPFDSMSLENIVGMRRAYAELKLEFEKLKNINP